MSRVKRRESREKTRVERKSRESREKVESREKKSSVETKKSRVDKCRQMTNKIYYIHIMFKKLYKIRTVLRGSFSM